MLRQLLITLILFLAASTAFAERLAVHGFMTVYGDLRKGADNIDLYDGDQKLIDGTKCAPSDPCVLDVSPGKRFITICSAGGFSCAASEIQVNKGIPVDIGYCQNVQFGGVTTISIWKPESIGVIKSAYTKRYLRAEDHQ